MAASIILGTIPENHKDIRALMKRRLIKLVKKYNNDFEFEQATPAVLRYMKAIRDEIVKIKKDHPDLPKVELKQYDI